MGKQTDGHPHGGIPLLYSVSSGHDRSYPYEIRICLRMAKEQRGLSSLE
ncbi:hypothetical protein B8V81_2079 [Paenibacillus pasadenensis]|uniref:Uncharacterized protein n=1 Tax=Paenibacillus pasadenensis TaxID=217090 RepID=A0A2N5MZY8_9BACL|nr:hypothetical protein B8V81_2079 [Paenibacillus pasadenensis]